VYQLLSPVRFRRIARVRPTKVLGHLPGREFRFAHVSKVPGQVYRFACNTRSVVKLNVSMRSRRFEKSLVFPVVVRLRNRPVRQLRRPFGRTRTPGPHYPLGRKTGSPYRCARVYGGDRSPNALVSAFSILSPENDGALHRTDDTRSLTVGVRHFYYPNQISAYVRLR